MDLDKLKVRRSFIFTPGLHPEMFPKAIASGADMVCIELEDGIAINDKEQARKNTIEALKTLEVKNDVELVVRFNNQRTKFGLLDLEAFISSKVNLKAIMLPKVKTPDEITFIDDLLTDCNLDTDLHVIMETNEALENIYNIAHASKRMVALYFGGVDMAAELRVENKWENLVHARSKLVHAGASVGVDVIDVPYLDLENMDGMRKEAEQVRNLGFTGKGSIHPKQIQILNEVFTPPKDEITKAKKILEEFQSKHENTRMIFDTLKDKIKISSKFDHNDIDIGASISCSGICLTVVEKDKYKNHSYFCFEVSQETISCSSVKFWKKNTKSYKKRAN